MCIDFSHLGNFCFQFNVKSIPIDIAIYIFFFIKLLDTFFFHATSNKNVTHATHICKKLITTVS